MVPSSVNVSCDSLFTVNYIKLSNVVPCLGGGGGGGGPRAGSLSSEILRRGGVQ